MFSDNSRYKSTETYTVTDIRGRQVTVVAVPKAPNQVLLGYHKLIQGQKPDHLAFKYLKDATAYWSIAEMNGAMLPEAISELPEIAIPAKS